MKQRFALYRQTQALRFWQTCCVLLQAGITLTEALNMSQQTVDDLMIKQQITYLIEQLQHGIPLGVALKNIKGFSPQLIMMLSLGEVSGQLEKALHYAWRLRHRHWSRFPTTRS